MPGGCHSGIVSLFEPVDPVPYFRVSKMCNVWSREILPVSRNIGKGSDRFKSRDCGNLGYMAVYAYLKRS
jgi:hypothetical protein